MSPAGANARRRALWVYFLASAFLALLLVAALGWYVTTNSFQSMVRRRLVAELERDTGGRVTLGSIHTSPLRFRVSVTDLTIHGREAAGEVPFAHVDRAVAVVRIVSVLGFEFGFHSLILDHPVLHVIEYPDGTTNQPSPRPVRGNKTAVERLFALSISRLEVRHGECIWNDQITPLEFTADDVSAGMSYSFLHRRYQTDLLLGKIVTHFRDYRPFAWMAEAHFSLGERSLDVTSLRATSGRSHLEVSGRVPDFRRPTITARYRATLDLGEAAGIVRLPAMRRGTVTASGQGNWSPAQFASTGKLVLEDIEWRDRALSLADASGSAEFAVSDQTLTLSQIQAKLLGGSVAGEAGITGWLNPPLAGLAKKRKTRAEQKGTVQLRVKGISAGALAAAISTPRRPLNRMNLAGAASGAVILRWKGALRNAEAEVALDVAAPPRLSPAQLPLNAEFRGIYHADTGAMEIANLTAATRATKIEASGQLSSTGALRLSVTTSNLAEWQPVLAAFGRPERIPLLLHGQAVFNGTAAGELPNLAFNGNLQATDFEYLVPPTGHTPAQTIHWDSLTAAVQFSQRLLTVHNGVLRHGDSDITFSLSAGLHQGEFSGDSPFTAQAAVHNAQLAELLSLAGYSYPFRGTVNLSFDASGTRSSPRGTGRLELTNGNIEGETVQQLECDLRFGADELQCGNLQLSYGAARVSGTAAYHPSTHNFQFDLAGTNFDLAQLPKLRDSRFRVQGQMNFSARGSGTLEAPVVSATVHLHALTFEDRRLGEYTLQASTQGQDLHFSGRSEFQNSVLNLDGTVQMRGDWISNTQVHFENLDADPLLHAYLQDRIAGHSSASGDVRLQGPLRRPAELAVAGDLNALHVGVENVQLQNDGPVRFEVSQGLLRIELFHLAGPGTDLSAHGTVRLTGEHQLDLDAQGHLNLKLIETFNADFTSSGAVALNMTVSGTAARPIAQGRVQITDGAIAYIDLPSALSGINGSFLFNQNHLQVETLTARTGGGTVQFAGNATWFNRQLNFDLDLRGKEVRLRYPPGVSSTANAHLRFAGSSSASTLSGDVTVTKLAVMPGFDFGAYLSRSSGTVNLPQTNPLLNRIRLDVHIVTTPELQMQTAAIRLSGDADLRLRGTAAKPVVLGRADVLEGQVYFNGTKYELERGNVSFTNPVTTTPLLDLQATTQVRDYDITLNLNGSPDKLKLTYRSEPPLPEADIITLLALGQTTEESAQLQQTSQNAFTQQASSAIISEALNATVSSRVQRLFGVSRIKINPEGASTETNPARGPQVTIEQQVGNNLTLTYSTSVAEASQQIIQVEYDISRNISIIGLRDQNGVVSFDLRIRRRKK
jgi:translocation and assembly module TamB